MTQFLAAETIFSPSGTFLVNDPKSWRKTTKHKEMTQVGKKYLILPEGCRFISCCHGSEESNDVGEEDEADGKVDQPGCKG